MSNLSGVDYLNYLYTILLYYLLLILLLILFRSLMESTGFVTDSECNKSQVDQIKNAFVFYFLKWIRI
jgi:hypothetical protein